MLNLEPLIVDFLEVARLAHQPLARTDLQLIELPAPHKPPSLPPEGTVAVYAFFLRNGECIKVGRTGKRSGPRYRHQHYGTNERSTVAGSILKHQAKLRLTGLTDMNIAEWMFQNTERANILMSAEKGPFVLALLETYMQCRLNPLFEGHESQRLPAAPRGILAATV